MNVYVLAFRAAANESVGLISAHADLAGAKKRARVYGAHHGMVWTESNSHGRAWLSTVEHGTYVVREMEVEQP